MAGWPILSLTTFLPLLGAAFIFLLRGDAETVARNSRNVALWTSTITLVLSLFIWFSFDPTNPGFQLVEKHEWIPDYNINYYVGIDGISFWFVLLSTYLTVICVIASWDGIKFRVRECMIAFLVLETAMIGTFCALDFFVFYMFFEGSLIPMFMIVGIWGGPRRIYATFKFFLYSLFGSVLTLVGILTMYFITGTADIPTIMGFDFPREVEMWLWLSVAAAFAIKVPIWPFHTWLPDTHVEAPTIGSVDLAGVLLKIGCYGLIRFILPIMPEATEFFAPLMFAFCLIGVVYCSLICLVQDDMKRMIAYSSIPHMAIAVIGIFCVTQESIQGAIMVMLSHGFVSGALFLCVGVVYERTHTRDMRYLGGVVHRMPVFAFVLMVLTLSALALPGTGGFVGEFMILFGAFKVNTWVATIANLGTILCAAYMLTLYRRVMYGELERDDIKSLVDLDARELVMFVPMVLIVLWMGIYPSSFLDVTRASSASLVKNYHAALDKAHGSKSAAVE
ncbi:NADH-quinone oxidoreductase chain 13 [Azospirillaceae bacterium]